MEDDDDGFVGVVDDEPLLDESDDEDVDDEDLALSDEPFEFVDDEEDEEVELPLEPPLRA